LLLPDLTETDNHRTLLDMKMSIFAIDVVRRFCRNPGMMKTRIALMSVAASFLATAACFAAKPHMAASPQMAANPHMGTWSLNEAKSKLHPGMGKNTTVVYAEKGDKIQVTVDGVDKDGKPTHSVWVGKFDGKSYKTKGNLPWDASAYHVVNDRTNDITTMKNGKVMWTGQITVAKDGKSRTVTVNGTDEAGKKFTSKAVYDKQ
jgi:hypothetical protein